MEELTGYWWRPGNPRRRVPGTITIGDDGRASLELLDLLVKPRSATELLPLGAAYPRVFGEVAGSDGKVVSVTLVDCQLAAVIVGGLPVMTLRPAVTLIGHEHVRNDRFYGAVVEFSGLSDWAGRSRPDYTFDETPYPRKVTIEYAAGDDVAVQLPFGRVTLRHGPVFTFGEEAHLEDRVTFRLEPSKPLTWDELCAPIRTLQNFIAFALDTTTVVTTRLVDIRPAREGQLPIPLRAIYQPSGEFPDPDYAYGRDRMLFSRRDIGDARLPDMLRRWFDLTTEAGIVIDLHLAALYRPRVFGETRFLFAAQSFEALHRESAQFIGESMPKAQFKAWRDGVVSCVDKADRPRVKAALGNQKGFSTVLDEILAYSKRLMTDLGVDRTQLKKRAAKSRNEIVHLLDRTEDPAALHKLAATLRLAMSDYLMQDIGFTDAEAQALLANGVYRGGYRVADWWSKGF